MKKKSTKSKNRHVLAGLAMMVVALLFMAICFTFTTTDEARVGFAYLTGIALLTSFMVLCEGLD